MQTTLARGRIAARVRSLPWWLALAIPGILAVAVRAPFFGWPLLVDEGGYATVAYWWFSGVTLYSDELWFDRPQGIFLSYKLGALLLGDSAVAIRLWAAMLSAVTTVFVALIAKQLFDWRTALLAAPAYAVLSALPQIEGMTANAEVHMIVAGTAGAYFALRSRVVASGLLAGCAYLLKPSGAAAVLLVAVWLLYTKRSVWPVVRFGIAAALPVALAGLHAALTVGLDAWVFAVVGYHRHIGYTTANYGMLRSIVETMSAWGSLTIILLSCAPRWPRHVAVFTLTWLAAAWIGVIVGGRWWPHYYMQLMPPVVVGGIAGLLQLLRSARPALRIALALSALVGIVPLVKMATLSPSERSETIFGAKIYTIAPEVAAYLSDHTTPDETVYVAWAGGNIYYLSARRPAVPEMFWNNIRFRPGAYDRLVATIEAREPTYVLALDAPITELDPENRFWQTLDRGYVVETTFDGVPLYRRR